MRDRLSSAYWWVQRTLHSLLGSKIEERHFRRRDRDDVRQGFSNVALPHRGWLADRLLHGPVEEILEVGCGWGPNLEVLARRAPSIRLTGVDISRASIREGHERFAELGLRCVTLIEGQADSLGAFANASEDVVFTDALLLYIGPDKIERTVREMMRAARRRVLLLEMHQTGAGAGGRYTRDGWVRDYEALLRPLAGDEAVRLVPLPPGLRTAGRWPEFGTLIEVDMTKTRPL